MFPFQKRIQKRVRPRAKAEKANQVNSMASSVLQLRQMMLNKVLKRFQDSVFNSMVLPIYQITLEWIYEDSSCWIRNSNKGLRQNILLMDVIKIRRVC